MVPPAAQTVSNMFRTNETTADLVRRRVTSISGCAPFGLTATKMFASRSTCIRNLFGRVGPFARRWRACLPEQLLTLFSDADRRFRCTVRSGTDVPAGHTSVPGTRWLSDRYTTSACAGACNRFLHLASRLPLYTGRPESFADCYVQGVGRSIFCAIAVPHYRPAPPPPLPDRSDSCATDRISLNLCNAFSSPPQGIHLAYSPTRPAQPPAPGRSCHRTLHCPALSIHAPGLRLAPGASLSRETGSAEPALAFSGALPPASCRYSHVSVLHRQCTLSNQPWHSRTKGLHLCRKRGPFQSQKVRSC